MQKSRAFRSADELKRELLHITDEIAEALAANKPVVALESTVIAHGLPRPINLETARNLEAIVRETGAVPATIGIIDGKLTAGLNDDRSEEHTSELQSNSFI